MPIFTFKCPNSVKSTTDRVEGGAFYRDTFEALCKRHMRWAAKTFPKQNAGGCAEHLDEEISEMLVSPQDPLEYADVIFMVMSLAQANGISPVELSDAVFDKLGINQRRKWPAPEEQDDGRAVHHSED